MMKRKASLMSVALAAVFGVPLTAGAQDTTLHQYPQASGNTSQVAPEDARFPGPVSDRQQSARQQAQPEVMVITIEPIAPRMSYRQRAESTFRGLDTDSDGEISMAEAGVNTQLVNAFQNLDRNSNGAIDRQEFAKVHVNDGSKSAQAASGQSSGGASIPPRNADEPWAGHRAPRSASSGASTSPLPSRSIEERAIGGYVGETVPPNTPGHPSR